MARAKPIPCRYDGDECDDENCSLARCKKQANIRDFEKVLTALSPAELAELEQHLMSKKKK